MIAETRSDIFRWRSRFRRRRGCLSSLMLFFADTRNEVTITAKYAKDRIENRNPSGPARNGRPVVLRQLCKLYDVQLKLQ